MIIINLFIVAQLSVVQPETCGGRNIRPESTEIESSLDVMVAKAESALPVSGRTTGDSLLMQGIYCSYREQYSLAKEKFAEAAKLEPKNPAPYFLLASLYALYMSDFSTDTLTKVLSSYCDTAALLAKEEIKESDTLGLPHLWLGGTYGLRAFYKIINENLVSGVQDAMKAISEISRAVELDSCLFDSYIGISGYNYFKYRLFSMLPWGGSLQWEKEIKLSCEKSKYFKDAAITTYASLLIEEKRYPEAIKIITQVVDKFPNSKVFRWTRVKAYCGAKMWSESRVEYQKLLELTLASQPETFYNIGYCRLELARTCLKIREKEECKLQCNEILALSDAKGVKKIKTDARNLLKSAKK